MDKFATIREAFSQLGTEDRRALLGWAECHYDLYQSSGEIEEPPHPVYENPPSTYLTRDEFLAIQHRTPIPYEFFNGILRQVSAPSVEHRRITDHIAEFIRAYELSGRCATFTAEMLLNMRLGNDEIVYRPDVMVICDDGTRRDGWVSSPKLVVEVMAPTTHHIDRREKLVNYQRLESCEEYVLASQTRPEVTVYRRAHNWIPDLANGLQGVAQLRSLSLSIPLSSIYRGVLTIGTPPVEG